MIELDATHSALVLIDLQQGVMGRQCVPRSPADVLATSKRLAERFRAAHAKVVLVNVAWSADLGDVPRQRVDQPVVLPPGGLPPEFFELAPGLAQPGDILITKRQWGAFHGTELDLQLRRRDIRTIVLGGIATNFGVESTARQAWELGYELVIPEDATSTSGSVELHELAVKFIFPRLARVVQSGEIALAKS